MKIINEIDNKITAAVSLYFSIIMSKFFMTVKYTVFDIYEERTYLWAVIVMKN